MLHKLLKRAILMWCFLRWSQKHAMTFWLSFHLICVWRCYWIANWNICNFVFQHAMPHFKARRKVSALVWDPLPIGDKDATLERFAKNFNKLSPNCQKRLTVENDDRGNSYSLKDLMVLHEKTGIPLVFDFHHHQFCTGFSSLLFLMWWVTDIKDSCFALYVLCFISLDVFLSLWLHDVNSEFAENLELICNVRHGNTVSRCTVRTACKGHMVLCEILLQALKNPLVFEFVQSLWIQVAINNKKSDQ